MATNFFFTMHKNCKLTDITEACWDCGSTEAVTKCEWCPRFLCLEHDNEAEEGSAVYACDSRYEGYIKDCIRTDARDEL